MKSTEFNYIGKLVDERLKEADTKRREERGTKKEYFYASDGLLKDKKESKCLRQMWYEFSNVEPQETDTFGLKTFAIGDVIHEWIQDTIIKTGKAVSVEGTDIWYSSEGTHKYGDFKKTKLQLNDSHISGRPDMKVRIDMEDGRSRTAVLEIKSIKNSNFMYMFNPEKYYKSNKWMKKEAIDAIVAKHESKPKPTHYQQIQFYLHAEKLEIGILAYVNKETGEIKEFLIEYDKDYVEDNLELYNKAYEVMQMDKPPARIYDKRPKKPKDGWHCLYCPYAETCWGAKE